MTYIVNATPYGKGWTLEIPALNRATQAHSASEIRPMAADLIEAMTGETEPSLDIRYDAPEEAIREIKRSEKLSEQARMLRRQAEEARSRAARILHEAGLSYADTGGILGISRQRAHQLATRNA